MLLGLPGGGKSSSGNTILGSEQFKSDWDLTLVSTVSMSKSAEVAGHWVTVVETPGFTDEEQLQSQKYQEIITESIAQARPGPHAFVIVMKLGRMSGADSALLNNLTKLLSSDALKTPQWWFLLMEMFLEVSPLIRRSSLEPLCLSVVVDTVCLRTREEEEAESRLTTS